MSTMERLARSLEGLVFDGTISATGRVDLNEVGAYACVRAILTALRSFHDETWAPNQRYCPHCDEYSFPYKVTLDFIDAILEGKA